MMSYFNPFRNTDAWSNDFDIKINVALEIITGNLKNDATSQDQHSENEHIGLVDIFTLGIFLPFHLCLFVLSKSSNALLSHLYIALKLLLLPIFYLRLLLGNILSILLMPFIAIAQLFSATNATGSALKATSNTNVPEEDEESPYNPFSDISLDKTRMMSFTNKLKTLDEILIGKKGEVLIDKMVKKSGTEELEVIKKQKQQQYGLAWHLTNILLAGLPYFLNLAHKSKPSWKANFSTFLSLLIVEPLHALMKLLLSLFRIVFFPLIVIFHLMTEPVILGKIPVWESFLANPFTWLAFAFLGFGTNLIIDALNPILFHQAAAILTLIPICFLTIGFVVGAINLIYNAICIAKFFWYKISAAPGKPLAEVVPFAQYLHERYEWMRTYPVFSLSILFIGFCIIATIATLCALYLTDSFLPSSSINYLMKAIFNFINSIFSSGIHGLAAWPGLNFLSDISPAMLSFLCHIFSAVTFTVGTACFIDITLRMGNTLQRTPDEKVFYHSGPSLAKVYKDSNRWSFDHCKMNPQTYAITFGQNIKKHIKTVGFDRIQWFYLKNGQLFCVSSEGKVHTQDNGDVPVLCMENESAKPRDFQWNHNALFNKISLSNSYPPPSHIVNNAYDKAVLGRKPSYQYPQLTIFS